MTYSLTPEVESRLHLERNVWLGTLRADGSPHITPVWFVYEAESWWVGSDGRSIKVRNLSADPRASLALENGDAPVVAEGIARIHRADFPDKIVRAFADKFNGWAVEDPAHSLGNRVLIEVVVSRWLLTGEPK
ncbi:pyridoxamine 5'-phosphate oxidase family protein [Ornithinimicrobium pratense]|uniref:Pyridoxamine 5'-phosphate oxidase n=1 Tax=Ornithinimicrobium pratense TaxID=2593973 RepID=A0A5J6V3Y0_9MICO|nr:pyridoxamine 5'-phosphate oxidase family protein [Ornithinimicrobium pratense]QFG68418.1 pyridoxamine 5'-phosphate oxidase [Ornithinimicrobium pratense]